MRRQWLRSLFPIPISILIWLTRDHGSISMATQLICGDRQHDAMFLPVKCMVTGRLIFSGRLETSIYKLSPSRDWSLRVRSAATIILIFVRNGMNMNPTGFHKRQTIPTPGMMALQRVHMVNAKAETWIWWKSSPSTTIKLSVIIMSMCC